MLKQVNKKKIKKYYNLVINFILFPYKKILEFYFSYKNIAIIMIDGGLGSQIVKYAFALALKNKTNARIYFDTDWFNKAGKSVDNKENRLLQIEQVFPNIELERAPKKLIKIYKYFFQFQTNTPHFFSEDIFKKSPVYYNGYYVNYRYFEIAEKTLRKDLIFSLKIQEDTNSFANTIKSFTNSIGIHVRRGDYIDTVHDVLDSNYYISTINTINIENEDTALFFFSNDFEYITSSIIPYLNQKSPIYYYESSNDTGFNDMYLMTLCSSLIIANSTFSWTAGWLNKNSIKYLPSKWFNVESDVSLHSDSAFVMHENCITVEI